MVVLSTELRPPRAVGPDRIVRLAAETGAGGLALGADGDLETISAGSLVGSAIRLGLEVPVLALPLPERPLPRGRRLPRLGAPAADERTAAIALAERGLEVGASFGVRAVLVDFGPVALAASAGDYARAFARREVDEEDPGGKLLADALAERRSRGAEISDACRWALERLLGVAGRRGVAVALVLGVAPWQAPSPREAGDLVATFGGAALGVAWDPGRLSALSAHGLPIGDDRLAALAAAAIVAIENDAVGLDAGYLPGLGERDPRLAGHVPPAGVPRIVTGGPDSTDVEVAAAVASARGV